MEYLSKLPAAVPIGRALVHNHVRPTRELLNRFQKGRRRFRQQARRLIRAGRILSFAREGCADNAIVRYDLDQLGCRGWVARPVLPSASRFSLATAARRGSPYRRR
jgi:hypothetical protein